MTTIDPRIFRAYDIRGLADKQITVEAYYAIARQYGGVLKQKSGQENPSVIVGRDARTHGPQFLTAVIDGLKDAGCRVLNMGETPSPLNYFTICHRNLDGGLQVTASHNPAHDNGLKTKLAHAISFYGPDIQYLRGLVEAGEQPTGNGWVEEIDALAPHFEAMVRLFPNIGQGKKVVVDGGNGVAGPHYCNILRAVGCEVVELYTEPDGTFPNHPADPSKKETLKELQAAVVQHGAHIGIAYDGDGDRVGVVDEKGVIRSSDEIILLLAKDYLSRHPGAVVISTVSNSSALFEQIEKWGGKPVMCPVGHANVQRAMIDHDAHLAGELSGHLFCGEEYYQFDDAIMATLCIIRALGTQTVSGVMAEFPKVYQAHEIRPHCDDEAKADVIRRVIEHFKTKYPVETMDGARIDFGEGAWAGIRQSNTSPCVSVIMEARSPEKLAAMQQEILDHLKTYPEVKLDQLH